MDFESRFYDLLAEKNEADLRLAESQARERVLYNALTTCVCAMQDYQAGIGVSELFDIGERNGRQALLQPADDTALKAALKAERERCASVCLDIVDGQQYAEAIRALENK